MPTTSPRPVCGNTALINSAASPAPSSTFEIARATARGSPASTLSISCAPLIERLLTPFALLDVLAKLQVPASPLVVVEPLLRFGLVALARGVARHDYEAAAALELQRLFQVLDGLRVVEEDDEAVQLRGEEDLAGLSVDERGLQTPRPATPRVQLVVAREVDGAACALAQARA